MIFDDFVFVCVWTAGVKYAHMQNSAPKPEPRGDILVGFDVYWLVSPVLLWFVFKSS